MDTHNQNKEDSPLRLYRPYKWMQLGLGFFMCLMAIHFYTIVRSPDTALWFTAAIIFIYGLLFWMLIIMSTQHHLAIFEDGIEYRLGGNRFFSRWDDLQNFESRRSGRARILGIVSTQVIRQQEGNMLENLMIRWHWEDFIPLRTVYIPTRWDGCWSGSVVDTEKLLETEFGRDLLHYAPQLFEYGEEKTKHGQF